VALPLFPCVWRDSVMMSRQKHCYPAEILTKCPYWLIFNIYNLCNVSTSESRQFVIVKNKLTSVFHAFVLLLAVNLVIALSVESSLWFHLAIAPWMYIYLTVLWRNLWSITGQRCYRAYTEFGMYWKSDEFYFQAVSINCSTSEWDLCLLIMFQSFLSYRQNAKPEWSILQTFSTQPLFVITMTGLLWIINNGLEEVFLN